MKRFPRIVAVLLSGLLLVVVFHKALLTSLGSYLVRDQAPRKADLAVVLAGDPLGNRIITAGQLVREGYVPKALVSGPAGFYGSYESDLEIRFAEKKGYPASYFEAAPNDSHSTVEEAHAMAPLVRRMGARRVLVVTSNYHTHRAGEIWRAALPGVEIDTVAAPDPFFSASGWWKNRYGRKIWLEEWEKTLANWAHL